MKPIDNSSKTQQDVKWNPWSNIAQRSSTAVVQQGLPTYKPMQVQDYGKIEQGNDISFLDKVSKQPIVELAQKAFDNPMTGLMMGVGGTAIAKKLGQNILAKLIRNNINMEGTFNLKEELVTTNWKDVIKNTVQDKTVATLGDNPEVYEEILAKAFNIQPRRELFKEQRMIRGGKNWQSPIHDIFKESKVNPNEFTVNPNYSRGAVEDISPTQTLMDETVNRPRGWILGRFDRKEVPGIPGSNTVFGEAKDTWSLGAYPGELKKTLLKQDLGYGNYGADLPGILARTALKPFETNPVISIKYARSGNTISPWGTMGGFNNIKSVSPMIKENAFGELY